ncbi:methylated-DNA--[protein]-cysteine S-methyltransferase [uncultured Gimesia sp.]|uniref:bifunctional transcriptional activator/DNA repair enzyme AdaA n=1 Tax=uncultured Gimesia sp. TaxID=1678688 RepID=UPI0030DD5874|tara:strand:+ start:31965 stop:33053 length:1089 start_codon:yes stop_codon:yes gene_type:complete
MKQTDSATNNRQSLPDRDAMYAALVQRNSSFEGVFVAAIRTTGIFCRPSCSARKPKPENVEYYPDAKTALANGYRECKICRPLVPLGSTPDWLQPLIEEVEQDATIRLQAEDLRERGLDPVRVRRWFQKLHGMSFAAYLRMRRINQAFSQIQHKTPVTDAAFQSGYESLSGFGEGFKKTMGTAPAKSNGQQVIAVSRILTPLGPMLAGATEQGICLLEFTDRRMLETQLDRLQKRLNAKALPGDSPFFAQLEGQLQSYFAGKRTEFDLPLITPGTEFQQKVWAALQTIPCGETRSYREQAEIIGQPKAVRAVARANGDNRIAILIPCHRVIGADGSLTGYGGGLWRKQRLLEIENADVDQPK